MCDPNIDMAGLRKSRRTRRTKRNSRGVSRRSKAQRGGATIVLKCTLDGNNKVQLTQPASGPAPLPPAGITLDNNAVKSLTITSTAKITDITFAGPGGPVIPRLLGSGSGIIIEQGKTALIPKGFTVVRKLTNAQKRLNSKNPVEGAITIRNLEGGPLGLTSSNRDFTITLTTV